MPEPLITGASIFVSAFEWGLGRLADGLAGRIKARLTGQAAARELAEIAERCVNAAVAVAPELSEILRTEAYTRNVLAPGILAALDTPTAPMGPDPFTEAFLKRFVEPYLARRTVDDVLTDTFKLEPERLQTAFRALVAALREEIWRSEHWKEPLRDAAIEETLINVRSVREDVAAIRARAETPAPEAIEARLDVARADARSGSTALRQWPKRIAGLYLHRPELGELMTRVRQHPGASTLVVGASGSGKSSLLSDLAEALDAAGLTVFAIKADELPADVRNLADVSNALGLSRNIEAEIEALSRVEPVVLIIDQLDAVSDVMDRTSQRMRLMLQLATRWRGRDRAAAPAVHVVVSSRPFEAHHDARFSALDAEKVVLALPSLERVEALLAEIGISADRIPASLRETVRRPFMLKLFVDLVERQADVGSLLEANLLTAWLTSAQLGEPQDRQQVVELLTALAAEMSQTETLWRPADGFDLTYAEAVRRAEACELLLRRDGRLGFAHQSWIDDFQARQFKTGEALVEHARAGQDSLFGRATLLRGLERLRAIDTDAYIRAVEGLLGDARTRRHLRFLVAGFLAGATRPLPQEVRWIEHLVRQDTRLALHALIEIKARWAEWRADALPLIALAARTPDTAWMASQLGVAEAAIDSASAEGLLASLWSGPDQDPYAFELCWRGGLWSPGVKARLQALFARAPVDGYAIANYLTDLVSTERAEAAVDLLSAYLSSKTGEHRIKAKFHDLGKVVDAAPLSYARLVLPWFVEATATSEPSELGARDRYPRARNLAYDWLDDHDEGGLFANLHRALLLVAKSAPADFLEIIASLDKVDIDEVQAMVAEGFAAAGAPLAGPALAWLLADPRRFHTGQAYLHDENNIGHTSYDYSTRLLLTAICDQLEAADLQRLCDGIEAWQPYRDLRPSITAKDLRDWRDWTEDARAGLLALLPPTVLPPRRRRQVQERVARQPKLRGARGRGMAQFVGSPMSNTQMSLASDDQIFQMIDSVHDQTDFQFGGRRREAFTGGVSQLSQAFAAFGKEHPARAMALVRDRFVAGRHETCAGALLRQLGRDDTIGVDDLLSLIGELAARGFDSTSWRHDAGWAMHDIAARREGLPDDEIARLEGWLACDPEQIAAQVERHDVRAAEELARERQRGGSSPSHALLFGRGGESLSILPGDNFPLLDAIGVGLLHRAAPAHGAWLDFLERHVTRAEDAAIWTMILSRHGWSLWHSDAVRVGAFFETLWRREPRALGPDAAAFLWVQRGIIPASVVADAVTSWFAGGEAAGKQLAGEFAVAARIVDTDNATLSAIATVALQDVDPALQQGAAFAAAAAWRESDEAIRGPAHDLLIGLVPTAAGAIAEALSTAVDQTGSLVPDDRTRDLLQLISANASLLKACLNRRFADGLQGLLLSYGFDEIVLEVAERAVELLIGDRPQRAGFIDKDFVDIAIALQKSDGAQRARAMDLYERLLEANAYGADRAAKDSLAR